ncbi:MAG: hypothetical protein Q4Q06_04435 [Bacteroidota bacterium]|nr:hypothetical protein [Bacteroidota bacterium]
MKKIKYNYFLLFLMFCLLFFSCKKNREVRQDNKQILSPQRIALPSNMVLSRIDIKDTIYKYIAHISYPTVLQKKDSLDITPVYEVWGKELDNFIDSVTFLYNKRLNTDTSFLSFELSKIENRQECIYLTFKKKVYLPNHKDTLKQEVFVNYNTNTKTFKLKRQ